MNPSESHGAERPEYDLKANEAVSQLSLKEKVALLSGSPLFWSGLTDMMTGGYSQHPWPAGEAPRLGVPGIRFTDGPRGVVLQGATTFPVSMARGAAWDVDLEERVGDVIGREARAYGANLFGGVCINLLRHPAWGRAQETYGEDSFHLGMLGAALVRGVQRHVMACAKHYACNSMENARFKVDVQADARTLREVYLPHFKRTVDAGVAAVMTSYNSVNGEWCGQNNTLIRDVLKRDWKFEGFTLTDFIFGMRDAKKAIVAGQDLEMPFRSLYARDLEALVERGEVPVELVNDAALRILRQEFRFAHRDGDYSRQIVGCEAHRRVALEAAEKSIVLLKNTPRVLPLSGRERVAVIGRLAGTPNTGDGGSSNTHPAYVVTPLQGLRELMPASAITYDDGSDAARAARVAGQADVALVVVGYTHLDEGEFISPGSDPEIAKLFPTPFTPQEAAIAAKMSQMMEGPPSGSAGGFSVGGDREKLTLRPEDEILIEQVTAANPRTIVAVMAGSAVIMEPWRERAAAILMLWYPGMEGGHALARILLGLVNPSGRLPCTFPRRSEDLPPFDREATSIHYDLWHGYRKLERDGTSAAFPFGFGLSYTTFQYSGFSAAVNGSGSIRANLTVTNTGTVPGDEVVQLYIRTPGVEVERASRELKAFQRVALPPGTSAPVTFEIPISELAYYDEPAGWRIEPGKYFLFAARHAEDGDALRAEVLIK